MLQAKYINELDQDSSIEDTDHIIIGNGATSKRTFFSTIKSLIREGLATLTDLAGKVDKVTGKGLSTEDYTTDEKTKLASLEDRSNHTGTQTSNTISDFNNAVKTVAVPITFSSDVEINLNGYAFQVTGIQEYANNNAAILSGVPVGGFYRTGDILKIVHSDAI